MPILVKSLYETKPTLCPTVAELIEQLHLMPPGAPVCYLGSQEEFQPARPYLHHEDGTVRL